LVWARLFAVIVLFGQLRRFLGFVRTATGSTKFKAELHAKIEVVLKGERQSSGRKILAFLPLSLFKEMRQYLARP